MQAFCVQSVDDLKVILAFALIDRLKKEPPTELASHIRSPVCLLFVRPRASPGDKLLEQVEVSFEYWYHATDSTLDIVLPGWADDKIFSAQAYANFEKQIVDSTKWKPSGETDALILDVVFDVESQSVDLDWSHVVYLPIEEMIRNKKFSSLDQFVAQLLNAAKSSETKNRKTSVWEISDYFGIHKGRRALWKWLKQVKYIGDAAKVYDELKPYAVCDLRK